MLTKSSMETARAKGLKEDKLIWKYPARVAMNPFFSAVGPDSALRFGIGGVSRFEPTDS